MHPVRRPQSDGCVSRRVFLETGAALVGGSLLPAVPRAASGTGLVMPTGVPRSRVIQMSSRHVIDGPVVHRAILKEMLDEVLAVLTGFKEPAQAWRAVLEPDDVIGIKFNRSGQEVLATTGVVADVLVASITEAGWHPDRLVCMEAPPDVEGLRGTTPPRPGYAAKATDFGSGVDQLASVLDQVTALIDVPFLKTHNIAGMTCALKNLSHAFVKHPARYHRNGCSPYIADIVGLPDIRDKLRFCLVDALRVVYDGGPEATAGMISEEGVLLASFDPVATDAVGVSLLNDVRRRHDLRPIARSASALGYLAAAHRKALGIAVLHGIDLVRRNLS